MQLPALLHQMLIQTPSLLYTADNFIDIIIVGHYRDHTRAKTTPLEGPSQRKILGLL